MKLATRSFRTNLIRFSCLVLLLSLLPFPVEYLNVHLQSSNSHSDEKKEKFWLWAKQAGGKDRTYGSGIAVDEVGNAYVAGFIFGTAVFDDTKLVSKSEMDMLIVKYHPNGSIAWIKQFGDTGLSNAQSVALGGDGNIYITGTIQDSIFGPLAGSARLGSFELRSNGGSDMFIAALNPSGEVLWVTQSGSLGEVRGESIAADGAGNCYVTGVFDGRFGNTDVVSAGKQDIFVAKYNQRGELVWVRGAGGPSKDDKGSGIAVDQNGSCYVTGFIGKEAIFDTVEIVTKSVVNFFLVKYDSNGVLLWVRHGMGNSVGSRGYGVTVDSQRNSYITGAFQGELVFGSTKLNSVPSIDDPEATYDDVFMAKYDPDGKPLWAVQGGGPRGDIGRSITVDAAGNAYATGRFMGRAVFGTSSLTSEEGVFVAKCDQDGVLLWAKESTKPGNLSGWLQSSGSGIAINARGDCYVTGFFDVAIQFGSIKLEGLNSRNMFVAKIDPR